VSATLDLAIAKYPGKRGAEMRIDTVSLDAFFAGSPIDVIKMDIEGAEVLAFQGMAGVFKDKRPVIFLEVHPYYIESLAPGGLDGMERLLKENNYCILDENDYLSTIYAGRVVLRPDSYPGIRRDEGLTLKHRLRKGLILQRLGKRDESREILEKIIKNRRLPVDIAFSAYYHLALTAGRGEMKTRDRYFREALKRLLAKKRKTCMDIYRIASLYKSLNRLDPAEKWFKKVLDMVTENRNLIGGVYFHLGEIRYFQQDFPQAEEDFKTCLQWNPHHKKAGRYLRLMEP
jgi:tetratricopeptide (TPR) repeat protein